MKQYRILYNPFAGGGTGRETAMHLLDIVRDGEMRFYDMTEIDSFSSFFAKIDAKDIVLVAGGDGTLNRFVNAIDGLSVPNDIYYFAAGSKNDFWRDLGFSAGDPPVCINRYLKGLPRAVSGQCSLRVLNGVGCGIDGYCCEESSRLRAGSPRRVSYARIALRGVLCRYRPVDAVVTVDGERHDYRSVWLAPMMHGRFYGGMMPIPGQDRLDPAGRVSVLVLSGGGRFRVLRMFRAMFKGRLAAYRKNVEILSGHDISVEFTRPVPIQVDGEVLPAAKVCRICTDTTE